MATHISEPNSNIIPAVFKSSKGAAAVEFALVLMLLVVLLFGMIEWGLYLFNRQVINNACREGARAGIVSKASRLTGSQIEAIVRNYSQQHLVTFGSGPPVLDVSILPIDNDMGDGFDPTTHRCAQFGCDLEVPAQFTYEFLFLPAIGIDSIDIVTAARMKME